MIRPRPLALLLSATLLAGGTLQAQPTLRLPAQDRPLAGAPAPVFAVGREEGQSWEMLSNVETVLFDAQDNLYLLDRGNHRVLVFDRNGRFVRQIGKEGDGPGELRVPLAMALAADGTLTVADLGQRRFNLFGRDGRFLRSTPFDDSSGMPMRGLAAHPAGGVVGIFRALPTENLRGNLRSGSVALPASALTRLPLTAGARPTRLWQFADASTARQTVDRPQGGGEGGRMVRFTPGPPMFSPPQLWGVLPGGEIAVSNATGYELRIVNPAGRTVRTLQRPVPVRPTTERDRARARQRRLESIRTGEGMITVMRSTGGGRGNGGGGGGMPAGLRAQMEQDAARMQFADTIPALRSLYVAPAGTLWVGRTGAEWDGDGPIDLVTAAGQYRGTLPRGQQMPAAVSASGRAAYIERDELEVERVVVRQLPATWR